MSIDGRRVIGSKVLGLGAGYLIVLSELTGGFWHYRLRSWGAERLHADCTAPTKKEALLSAYKMAAIDMAADRKALAMALRRVELKSKTKP